MIKKRVIISIILTLLAVWGSHNYWLIRKPIDISFNIQGNNIEQVEVQLNKHNSDNFKKCYYQRTEGKIKNNAHLKFSFKKPFAPKRLKLLITLNSAKGGGGAINGLKLRDGKRKINDLENFSAQGADLKIENNKLFFKPKQNQFSITYDKNLNVRASIKFDILVLLIITIVTYLVAFKFTSYLADFKINKNKSRIDIVFLAIFFLIMFIPMMRISNEKTSKAENRTLATYKPLFKTKGGLNFNYGKDFDNWFSDRFNFRDKIIYDFKYLQLNLQQKIDTERVLGNKENKWLFYKGENSIINYTNKEFYTQQQLENIASYLTSVNDYCNKHNKKFYLFIAPDKNKIYDEYFPTYILKVKENKNSKTEQLIEYLHKNTTVKVIYPYEALRKAKNKGVLYYKMDTHWNLLGGYVGYIELMKEIKKDFPITALAINKYTIDNRTEYDLHNMLYKNQKYKDETVYKKPYIKNQEAKCSTINNWRKEVQFCTNKNKKYNIYIYRDSFTFAWMPYINETFKNTIYDYNQNRINFNKIKDSDIILLESVERIVPSLTKKKLKGEK